MPDEQRTQSNTGLTEEQLGQLADRLQGTCEISASSIAVDLLGLNEADEPDESDLEDDLADLVGYCQGCGWWYEASELGCSHDVVGYCETCRVEDGYCEECRREARDEEADDAD